MTRRLLIIRPGAIGDFIVSLPALEFLRNSTPGYAEVWVPRPVVPLVRFADRVRAIADTGLDRALSFDPEPLLRELRSFDSIVSWYGSNSPEFRSLMLEAGLPVTFHPALPAATEPAIHATDFYLKQVGAPLGGAPKLFLQNEPNPKAAPFVAIHPFSGGRRKNWPLESFRELARKLDLPVCWAAGPEEELPEAARFDSLYDLAVWLREAKLYVGNDSGITHLAAAVGIPVVAIFQASDPRVWAPRGERVAIIGGNAGGPTDGDSVCVEDVALAARRLLSDRG